MKRALALAAFLALFAVAGVAHAQDTGDGTGGKDTEQPKKDDAKPDDSKKDDASPDKAKRPERPDRRNRRMDRKTFQELGRVLREKDADGDRKLSKAELGDDELFKTLDKDEDGFVTLQEMIADKDALIESIEKQAKAVMKEEFGILDRDDSGKLTKEELGEEFASLLETGDKNKDGQLDFDEFTAAREAAKKDKVQNGRPGAGRDPFADLDKDKDGKISKEEAGPRMKQYFDRLDKNGDGYITKDELKAARGMRGKRANNTRKPGAEDKKDGKNAEDKKTDDKKDGDKTDGKKKDEDGF